MSEEDREKLADMIEEMLQNMTPEQLRELFESMMTGQNMSREQIQEMLARRPPARQYDQPILPALDDPPCAARAGVRPAR